MTGDIDILAATAYETGIDPIDYAAEHVIRAHVEVFLGIRDLGAEIGFPLASDTAALSRRIVADLLNAGWQAPEVTG
jgi:hypothetical protein